MTRICFVFFAATAVYAHAQSAPSGKPIDLSAETWRPHSKLIPYNLGVEPLNTAGGQISRFIVGDLPSVGDDSPEAVVSRYQKHVCDADAVIVGTTHNWASHLSAQETSVYTDYDFAIDKVLKNKAPELQPGFHIVVTAIGGSAYVNKQPVSYDVQRFPRLQEGAKYLLLLSRIPETGAYRQLDLESTLTTVEEHWVYATNVPPPTTMAEFLSGELERLTIKWASGCK